MSEVELSIAPTYVKWGMWEALRELIQNAKDADDLGYKMDITYFPKSSRLEISNAGVKLGRETLVLGNTSKRDNINQRGEFGEGYKLALATLLNLQCKISMFNDTEVWQPFLKISSVFNTVVLALTFSKAPMPTGALKFEITGVSPEVWKTVSERLLFLGPTPESSIKIDFAGHILNEAVYKSKLYVKGIFVGNLPQEHWFGYDLLNVKLDRDRNLADPFSLKSEIRAILKKAVILEKIDAKTAFEILGKQDVGESGCFISDWDEGGPFHMKIKEFFVALHGENAIPVEGMGEAIEAQHYGLKGVIVSPAVRAILSKVIQPFVNVRKVKATEAIKTYCIDELSKDEIENFRWATSLVSTVEPKMDVNKIAVVDFRSVNVHGTFDNGYIRLSKTDLVNRKELIATTVHEVSHFYGADGTVEHRDACERIFSEIICLNMNWSNI